MICPACSAAVLDIDVRCAACGAALGASGAHRMIGSIVLGQYEVVDVLGQGGMSVVYKGRHKLTEQDVALKILPPELAANSQVKGRFLEEARALATLDHANIVHLYNFGQENGCFVLAMQLVQGQTWERMILENKKLDWQTSVRIAIDVLRALEYAHGRGVVHRDMKPSNVLVRAHDGAATVMDFGIAKMTTSTKLTATGQTMGTVRYMSPEQVRGHEVDARTDLYSLGATMFESLTGDTPFDGDTHFEIMTKHLAEAPVPPSSRGVEVPAVVEDAVMRSLAKKPEDRFESARDMRKALEGSLRDADLGLVETQRVSRDVLAAALPAAKAAGASQSRALGPAAAASAKNAPRAVSASTDLADRLEPTSGRPARRSRTGRVLAGLLALAVLAGGGATAYWWKYLRAAPAGGPITLRELEVEASGDLKRADVLKAYMEALDALDAYLAHNTKIHIVVQRPLDRIIAVPAKDLCAPNHYPKGSQVPPNCATAIYAVTTSGAPERTLLIANDPATLKAAMIGGVADAVCLHGAFAVAGDSAEDGAHKLSDTICEIVPRFVDSTNNPPPH